MLKSVAALALGVVLGWLGALSRKVWAVGKSSKRVPDGWCGSGLLTVPPTRKVGQTALLHPDAGSLPFQHHMQPVY